MSFGVAILCSVLLFTSLAFNANGASSSVTYHKWRLKLVAVYYQSQSQCQHIQYYKCIYEQKLMFCAEDDEVSADSPQGR